MLEISFGIAVTSCARRNKEIPPPVLLNGDLSIDILPHAALIINEELSGNLDIDVDFEE